MVEYLSECYPGHRRGRRIDPSVRSRQRPGQKLNEVNVLVCIKRVPMVGGRIAVTPDAQEVDTRLLGFTVSPHEECAVEEAVRIVEDRGGSVSVLTLGPPEAADQLRDAVAIGAGKLDPARDRRPGMGAHRDGRRDRRRHPAPRGRRRGATTSSCSATRRPTPATTRSASVSRTHSAGRARPASSTSSSPTRRSGPGASSAAVTSCSSCACRRWSRSRKGSTFPATRPCPAGCGQRRRSSSRVAPEWHEDPVRKEALRVPVVERQRAEILGTGVEAVPALVELLEQLGVLP